MTGRPLLTSVLGCALAAALASGCGSSHGAASSTVTSTIPASSTATGGSGQSADLAAIAQDLQDLAVATGQENADVGAAAAAQAQNDDG